MNSSIFYITSNTANNILLQIRFRADDGKSYSFSIFNDGIQLWSFASNATVWKIAK